MADKATIQMLQTIAKKLSARAANGDSDAAAYLTILQKEAPLPGMPGYDSAALKWDSGGSSRISCARQDLRRLRLRTMVPGWRQHYQ